MSEILKTVGAEIYDMLSFFVTVALLQNVVLTTGFGSTVLLNIIRKPKTIWLFTGILAVFAVCTCLIAYPVNQYISTAVTNYWRPLIIVGITVVLYLLISLVLMGFFPNFYKRVGNLLPMAAFNNLVVGIALVSNVHFTSNLGGIIGLAFGSCLGFGLLSWIVAEGIERLDNPDMPAAFRGMPSTLVYLGLLALAFMGFTSNFSLI